MFLFAEASNDFSIAPLIGFFFVMYAIKKWAGWIGGNPVLRKGAQKGAIHLLSRIFK